MADAGDIRQNIQRADSLRRLRTVRFAGDIECEKFSADAFRVCPPVVFITVGDPDRGAGLSERFRHAAPMPEAAPVTRAVLFWRLNTINPFCVGLEQFDLVGIAGE